MLIDNDTILPIGFSNRFDEVPLKGESSKTGKKDMEDIFESFNEEGAK